MAFFGRLFHGRPMVAVIAALISMSAAAILGGIWGGSGYIRYWRIDWFVIFLQLLISLTIGIFEGKRLGKYGGLKKGLIFGSLQCVLMAAALFSLTMWGGLKGAIINAIWWTFLLFLAESVKLLILSSKGNGAKVGYLGQMNQSNKLTMIDDALQNKNIINQIKADLHRIHLLGYKEQWRLGMFKPGEYDYIRGDMMLPNKMALLFPKGLLGIRKANLLHLTEGPRWNQHVISIERAQYTRFPDNVIAMDDVTDQLFPLQELLRNKGFPITSESLCLERSGVVARESNGTLTVVRTQYFFQRTLIDNEGHIIYIGMDESKDRGTFFAVYLKPAVTSKLVRYLYHSGYAPVFRYHTFPQNSERLIALIDYPMANIEWADLHISPDGRCRIFIPKEDIKLKNWNSMLTRLRALWISEIKRANNHLLMLTNNPDHLASYLFKKERILSEYFSIVDKTIDLG